MARRASNDDPTLAGMADGSAAPKPRARGKGKSEPEAPRESAWEAVARECPCDVSAEEHRDSRNPARVHLTTHEGPVLCLPGKIVEQRAIADNPPVGYRKTSAFNWAEFEGRPWHPTSTSTKTT